MRALVIGAGGVGRAIANIASRKEFITAMVVADKDLARAEEAVQRLNDERFTAAEVNAAELESVREIIRETAPDVVINAVDPRFVMPIFLACEIEDTNYMDMAMSLSRKHPHYPYVETGVKLGDEQFARDWNWSERGIYALVGIGIEPGMSDVFARYASDEIFSRIDSVTIFDGSNITVEGYEFAPSFSIWTTIEECLNPPLVWEDGRGWYTTEPFSEPEIFDFPEGIGPVECVNVEHEEVVLIPQKVDAKKVNFKYGLGEEFIGILKTIHMLGMDRKENVEVQGVLVSPRDLLAASLPDPATLGARMRGKTCAGTLVKGLDKEGKPRAVYLYHVVDNQWSMKEYGDQAVVWQTALNPVIAMELIHEGIWKPEGVNGPEWFDPKPFLNRLESYGAPWGIREEDTTGIIV
ncbi:MAG TPA: saccharopine dehydrogenase C-terminal domain-containing protein [Candidatus Nanopelagicaceae bacterium]|nr:saccharopine dehydrogenase C-terminal domain-containing protein [Candidatus Nanopelagicaceae bacterium]